MKGKIIPAVLLSVLFLSVFVAYSHAYRFPSASRYGYSFQQRLWEQRELWLENQDSVEWLQDQIGVVLDQLQEMGFDFPEDIEQNLDTFLSDAFSNLIRSGVRIPFLSSELFGQPDYNLSWNYDVTTGTMDFSANNVFVAEKNYVLVDFGGDLYSDGQYNLDFFVQGAPFNQEKISFNQGEDSSGQNKYSRRTGFYQTRFPSRMSQSTRDFLLEGKICQDGLVSLYFNPRKITVSNFRGVTYTTQSGIAVFQYGEYQEGIFYLDIMGKNPLGEEEQVYYWEMPLALD